MIAIVLVRVVLDTNILVSSLLNDAGNEAAVLDLMRRGSLTACYTAAILREYREVLTRRKFGFTSGRLDLLFEQFEQVGQSIEEAPPAVGPEISPDPSDTKFIACAIAANAAFLVTGNRRHFPAAHYSNAEVVNARELLARLPAP